MKFDGRIDIATGLKSNTKTWKNRKLKWSALVKKLTTEHRTNETVQEYAAASKPERGRIKDVGGYFGGYLRNGRRKPANVLHKQLITLDVDYAHADFWDEFTLLFSNAAVLHSTHSYTDASPRYRLIMPLSREVSPDEYVAISRKVAENMGIELFDNTTFQVHRFMYYPSCSSDAKYYAKFQDGQWLDADEVLEQYVDWTDTSEWATSAKNLQAVRDASMRQQDPQSKNNVIGMFCRSYSVSEAIDKFLTEQYIEVENGRYTYTGGSTSGGLVTYDDKFAYSHHGTDPTGGKLCNAFDLVRIHRFAHLDTEGQKNPTKTKSYKAMVNLAIADKLVKKLIASERIESAKFDFTDEGAEPLELDDSDEEELDLTWTEKLQIDARGTYLNTSTNLNLIFRNDPKLMDAFKYNDFDAKRYVFKSLAWRKIKKPEPIKNVDYSGIRNYIEVVYGITGSQKIEDALALQFQRHCYHPVTEYLSSLKWDGKPRIDTLLIDYFNAKDTLYTREAIRVMFVGAVNRVFRPGCKFDLVLVLSGEQGVFKSTFIEKIAKSWFSDSFYTFAGKEAYEQLHGAWIIEMAELSAMSKSEVEAAKHFITKTKDSYRPAYARAIEDFLRQCVFFATTNKKAFLKDATGNRRFLPVDVEKGRKDPRKMKASFIDQLWAEAMELYKNNAPLYLSDEAKGLAVEEQRQHSEVDERVGIIEKYLNTLLPEDWGEKDLQDRRLYLEDDLSAEGVDERYFVCIPEIWCECLGKSKKDMQRWKTRELNDIMKTLDGWEYVQSTKNFKLYGKQKYYKRCVKKK